MIELIFIIALNVIFIHACFWEGMIFENVKGWFWDFPEWIKKPLFDCPICMSIWWGLLIYAVGRFFDILEYRHPFELILCLFAAGGINTVLIYIISSDKAEIKESKEDDLPKSVK